jgi:hypothetical protein
MVIIVVKLLQVLYRLHRPFCIYNSWLKLSNNYAALIDVSIDLMLSWCRVQLTKLLKLKPVFQLALDISSFPFQRWVCSIVYVSVSPLGFTSILF